MKKLLKLLVPEVEKFVENSLKEFLADLKEAAREKPVKAEIVTDNEVIERVLKKAKEINNGYKTKQ